MFTLIDYKKKELVCGGFRNPKMRFLKFILVGILMLTFPTNADAEKGRLHSPYGTTKIAIYQNPTENALTVHVGISGDSIDILERKNDWVKISFGFNVVGSIGWVQEEYVDARLVGSSQPESKVQDFIDGLVGQQAVAHIKRSYGVGPLSGWKKNHYQLAAALEADGIFVNVNNGNNNSDEDDSCRNATGLCINLQQHVITGPKYAISKTHADELQRMNKDFLTVKLGIYEQISVLSIKQTNNPDCEWDVRVRAWFNNETDTYKSIQRFTGFDGYVHDICLFNGRNGLVWKYNSIVFN